MLQLPVPSKSERVHGEEDHAHTHEEEDHALTHEEGDHAHKHEEEDHTHEGEYAHTREEEGHLGGVNEGEKGNITDSPRSAFTEKCVLTPLRKWFQHHITDDTVLIAVDMLLHGNGTVKRVQAGFENFYMHYWWSHAGVNTLDKSSLVVSSVALLGLLMAVYLMMFGCAFTHEFFRNNRRFVSFVLSLICFVLCLVLVVLQLKSSAERKALVDSFAETLDLSEGGSADEKLVLIRNRFQEFRSAWSGGYARLALTLALALLSYVYLVSQPRQSPRNNLWQFLHALCTPALMSVTLVLFMAAATYSALGGHLLHCRDYATSLRSTLDPNLLGTAPADFSSYYLYRFAIFTWFIPLIVGIVAVIADMAFCGDSQMPFRETE